MATVRLGRYELTEYELPRVCMRCGARAVTYKAKKFQWYPPWAFFVLGWIGALLFMKTVTMDVPLCAKHKWHWGSRTTFVLVGLVAFVGLFFGAAVVASGHEEAAPFLFIPLLVLFVAWLIAAIVLAVASIRPTEITDKSITLRGVSEEFIEALDEERRGHDDEDDDEDEDEDEDEDRPRRRRRDEGRSRSRRRDRDVDEDDGGYYDPDRRRRRR